MVAIFKTTLIPTGTEPSFFANGVALRPRQTVLQPGELHVIKLALVGFVLAVSLVLGLRSSQAAADQQPAVVVAPVPAVGDFMYEVVAGDTIWDIATRYSGDVRLTSAALLEANGAANIVPGQRLVIPAELKLRS